MTTSPRSSSPNRDDCMTHRRVPRPQRDAEKIADLVRKLLEAKLRKLTK